MDSPWFALVNSAPQQGHVTNCAHRIPRSSPAFNHIAAIESVELTARIKSSVLHNRFEFRLSYPIILGLDPHDDYAEETTAVCRKRHREFTAAVNQLPEKDRAWFLRVVFEPSACRVLHHPEAD
jgi:hypothetical protein